MNLRKASRIALVAGCHDLFQSSIRSYSPDADGLFGTRVAVGHQDVDRLLDLLGLIDRDSPATEERA